MDYVEFKNRLMESQCAKCPDLCRDRQHIVVDRGNSDAKLMIIGEAPGEKEDFLGKAFVGRAGGLLDKLMAAIDLDTNRDMLIVNVVKCRPPNNRPPTSHEADNCRPYLEWQIQHVRPQVVVLLGATAAKHLMPEEKGRGMKERVGRFFNLAKYPQAKFFLLYHPAYLLRDPRKIPETVEHLKILKSHLFLEEERTHESAHC
ncbi:MAG: Type-4 uracil-DNA glycosylase [Elusimicrobia bacterium]|nr:Type-4 uracil-DNA glycosylase [Elusimicrobiota bacterium]